MSIFTQKLLTRSSLVLSMILSASLLSACNSPAGGNTDVSARQDIMKNWGDAMEVMGGMMKNPDTFDAAKFKEQAAFLAGDAKNPWSHFADKTATGHATEAVWSNAEEFKNEAAKFEKVTADLNAAAQNATRAEEVQTQFQAVGGTCKSCHTDFKVKED